VLSQVGDKPVALLELKTKTLDPKEKDPEPFPYFHFDQTFLAPVSARWKTNRDWIQIEALGDWETRRNRSRFTHVLASKITATVGGIGAASFTRSERELLSSTAPRMPQAITDLGALEEVLSNEGLRFLTALLETH
jgi:nucleoid-associated protein YgaU